jgi:predicted lipoprotein with Yx(FWY)xxD motif
LLASPLTQPWDDWSVVDRRDGTFQWEYKGKLLYTFHGDVNAREVNGDGRGKSWQAVVLEPMPPTPSWVRPKGTDAGEMLGDAKGMTIYYYIAPKGRAECVAYKPICISPDWRPIVAEADAKPIGDWTILTVADGKKQWAYKGHRLFTYARDTEPGEFKGIMFGGNGGLKVLMRSGDPLQGVGGAGG